MASSIVHDTDASTGTSTGTNGHILPLNNHFNMKNAMMSLMVPLAPCDRKHVHCHVCVKGHCMCVCMCQNASQRPHISHTFQLVHVHILDNDVSINAL